MLTKEVLEKVLRGKRLMSLAMPQRVNVQRYLVSTTWAVVAVPP